MRTWFLCTDKKQNKQRNVLQELIDEGFIYDSKVIYLGEEQTLASPDGNLKVFWSVTSRDGIWFQIKRIHPYHIMFDYFDGAVVINDNRDGMILLLNKIKDDLDNLKMADYLKSTNDMKEAIDIVVLRNMNKIMQTDGLMV